MATTRSTATKWPPVSRTCFGEACPTSRSSPPPPRGKLTTAAGILTEAQRMLEDPKARTRVSEFHQQYAHMGEGTRWAEITRDPTLYPAFAPAMTPLLSEETKRFFDYIVFEKGGTFRDLLTSPVGFVNATLAPLYGLNPGQYGANLTKVDLDPATRSGVFTRAGFLASYSLYDRASPILRGAFIQKEVLCTAIPPPPPGVEGTPFPTTGATNRERVNAQTASTECAGCHHTLINPTGFALEAYDAIGALQTKEKDTGAPINTMADVLIGPNAVSVAGPVDLMDEDRSLAGGAALLRAEVGAVCVRTHAHQPGRLHRARPWRAS